MKNLLLFILLLAESSLAQNYSLQKNAKIYDLPGGAFLSAITLNDSTFIKHYDVTGTLIWQDTLTFNPAISPVYFNKIAHFKNTNEYIISVFADPSPQTEFWSSQDNDTLVYQFTKLDLNSHLFTANLIDTFECKSMQLLELKDTSIYLFVSDFSMNMNPYNNRVYSINPSMEVSVVAPSSYVPAYIGACSFTTFGDSIYKFQTINDSHGITQYSLQMDILNENWTNLTTTQDYQSVYYRQIINKDSVFIFTEGTSSGSWYVNWRMDWVNLSLGSINSTIINTPLTDQPPMRYATSFNNVAIDRANRKIIVLTEDNSPISSGLVQKIFIYDFNFNLVCEIPVNIGTDEENSLTELNGLVYLRNDNSINSELIKIDCSMLGVEEFTSNDEFDIYPNPAKSKLFISNPNLKFLSISVLSTDGKELKNVMHQENHFMLDLDYLPKGMYLLEINDGSKTEIKRIVKE